MTSVHNLGGLVSFRTGKLNSNAANPSGAYPFFTCSQETYRTDTYSFDTECVLLAGNNANGIYPIKYFSGRFDAYQRTYVIESLDKKVLLNRYLYYALQVQLEHLRSISTGAATKFLTLTILNGIEIKLPTLPRQEKIVYILSAYDDLIENNTQRIAIMEEMVRRIYSEWFVSFRFPGHENVRTAESALGPLPEGWRRGSFGDVAKKKTERYTDSLHSSLPLIDLSRIPRRSNSLLGVGLSDEIKTSRLIFRQGEVLFGAIRPNFHKVLLAPFDGVSNVSVHIFENKGEFGPAFLFSTAFADETVSWAIQHSGGMKMPTINWDVLSEMPVLLPSNDVLARFEKCVTPLLQQITTLVRKNLNLRATRDLLLPKLISGELDVSELPEPEATTP
ncbi:restriction endonuclease subunit S [Novilysobacter antarcticus]|uniref:restriction endonuclease subunit S n=1 Tax=Novilysobacter antarcticus TaxID=2862543 RepID=UPI001C99F710